MRRLGTLAGALAILGGLPSVAEPGPSSATCPEGRDWPRFLGPDFDGTSCEPILRPWPESGPEVLWFRTLGEGYSAPTVVEDRVLVFDRVGDEARLAALTADGGEEIWRSSYPSDYEDYYRYSGGPRTTPVVDDDRVFVLGVEGRLRAHDLEDGDLLWEVDTNERFGVVQNFFGVGSTPFVEGDLLIAMIGGSPRGSPRIHSGRVEPNGTGIVAFDKTTGEVRYRTAERLASYSSPIVADVGGRRLGVALLRSGLLAFDPRTGAEGPFFPWRAKKLESVNAATPVVVGDTVLITESYGPGGALLRLVGDAWETVWKDPPRGKSLECHWSTPIVLGGVIYASSGQSSGEAELRAIDHATGEILWSEPGLGRSTLLGADGHLVVLTERGRLLLVEATPERYALVSETDLGDSGSSADEAAKTAAAAAGADRPVLRFPAWNAPVLSRGRLFLRGRDQLVVLRMDPRAGPADS